MRDSRLTVGAGAVCSYSGLFVLTGWQLLGAHPGVLYAHHVVLHPGAGRKGDPVATILLEFSPTGGLKKNGVDALQAQIPSALVTNEDDWW